MTVGDPRGIGPEIVAKALADSRVGERCDIVVVGPQESGVRVDESVGRWKPEGGATLAGMLSGLAIERAVQMAMAGDVDGIVAAPLHKTPPHPGGYDYPRHTEKLGPPPGAPAAVIAPYHDVGMTAIKVASFGSAVNVTLGLPFARTSPDHGTALDIAGQNRADPSSMIAATLLCASIVARGQSRGGRRANADRLKESRSSGRSSRAQSRFRRRQSHDRRRRAAGPALRTRNHR